MCGIWSFIKLYQTDRTVSSDTLNIVKLFEDFYNLKHRGPDNSYFETYNNVTIGFHRLAIMDDRFSSNQPFIIEDTQHTVIFICNGEIYNFKNLITQYGLSPDINNDCIVIPHIYMNMMKNGNLDLFNRFIEKDVKGEFAFILFDFDNLKNLKKIIVGRDEIGVRPLYYTPDSVNTLFFSSEVKGGLSQPHTITEFPPGYIYTYSLNDIGHTTCQKYNYTSVYDICSTLLPENDYIQAIQKSVINAVRCRLNADKPIAFLLSGGVDSSLVAGISARILGKTIRTFCCSLADNDGKGVGTDLQYARMVAKYVNSTHTEVLFTPEEGLAVIPDVIRTIESWDTTTVRASVIQYMVCKYIGEKTDCKVVMVGEGVDEVSSSYLFNWFCPDGGALHNCSKDYVKNIHYYDVKRADRCIARWGLEGRVPFLDSDFIKTYWAIPGKKRMPIYNNIEKWWFRKAFDGTYILPDKILWRTKEAQSDGCSSKEQSWFQIIQEHVNSLITDEEFSKASDIYPYCTPMTKEAFYYRKLFCEYFGEDRQKIIPGYWQPKWNKHGQEVTEYIDPSARILDVYNKTS